MIEETENVEKISVKKRMRTQDTSSLPASSSPVPGDEEDDEGEEVEMSNSSCASTSLQTLYDSDEGQISHVVSLATTGSCETTAIGKDVPKRKSYNPGLVENINNNVRSDNIPAHSYSADFVSSPNHHHHHHHHNHNPKEGGEKTTCPKSQQQSRYDRRVRRSMQAKCSALKRQDAASGKQAGKKLATARTSKSCTTECEILRLNYKAPSPRQVSELMVGFCNLTSDWVSDASDEYDIILFDDEDDNDEENGEEDQSFARSQADSQSYHGDLEMSLDDDAHTVSSKEDASWDITAIVSSLENGDHAFSVTHSHLSESKSNHSVPSRLPDNPRQTSPKKKLHGSLESIEPRESFHSSGGYDSKTFGVNEENATEDARSSITSASIRTDVLEAKCYNSREMCYSSRSTSTSGLRQHSSPQNIRAAIMRAVANGEFDDVSPVLDRELDDISPIVGRELDGVSPNVDSALDYVSPTGSRGVDNVSPTGSRGVDNVSPTGSRGVDNVSPTGSRGVDNVSSVIEKEFDEATFVFNGKADDVTNVANRKVGDVTYFSHGQSDDVIQVPNEEFDVTYIANDEATSISRKDFEKVIPVWNEKLNETALVENEEFDGATPEVNGDNVETIHNAGEELVKTSSTVTREFIVSPVTNGLFDKTAPIDNAEFNGTTYVDNRELIDISPTACGTFDEIILNAGEELDTTSGNDNQGFDNASSVVKDAFNETSPVDNVELNETAHVDNGELDGVTFPSVQGESGNYLLHENQNSFPQQELDEQTVQTTISASVHNTNLSETTSVANNRKKKRKGSVRKGYSTSLLFDQTDTASRCGIKIDFMSEIVPLSPTNQVSLVSSDTRDDRGRDQECELQVQHGHEENASHFQLHLDEEGTGGFGKEIIDDRKNVDLNFSGAQGAQYRSLPSGPFTSSSTDTSPTVASPAGDNTYVDDQEEEVKGSQTPENFVLEAEDGSFSPEGGNDIDREFSNLETLHNKSECSMKNEVLEKEGKEGETLHQTDKAVQMRISNLEDQSKHYTSDTRLQSFKGIRRKKPGMKGKRFARQKRKDSAHEEPGPSSEKKKSETQFLSLLLSMVESEHQTEEDEDGRVDAEALAKPEEVEHLTRHTGPRFPRGIDAMGGISFSEISLRTRKKYSRVTDKHLADFSRKKLRSIKNPKRRIRKGRKREGLVSKADPALSNMTRLSCPVATRGNSLPRGSNFLEESLGASFGCHEDNEKQKNRPEGVEEENEDGLLLRTMLNSEHEIYAQTEDAVDICEDDAEFISSASFEDSYQEQNKLFRADGRDKYSALKEYYAKRALPKLRPLQDGKSESDPDTTSLKQKEAENVSSYSRISKIKFQAPSIVKDERLKTLSVSAPDASGGTVPRQMWDYPSMGGYRNNTRGELQRNASLDSVGEKRDMTGSLVTRSLQEMPTKSIIEDICSTSSTRQMRLAYTDLLQANAMREIKVMRKHRDQLILKKAQVTISKQHEEKLQNATMQKKVSRARQAGVVIRKVKSNQDPWNSTVNEMLLKAHRVMEGTSVADSGSRNNRYPRSSSARKVSPVPGKKFNFLNELLEQDRIDTSIQLSKPMSPIPAKRIPRNRAENAVSSSRNSEQVLKQTTPSCHSDEDRNQNEKRLTKLPSIEEPRTAQTPALASTSASPSVAGRTLIMSGIMEFRTSSSPLNNHKQLLSRFRASNKTPMGSFSHESRSPVRASSSPLQSQNTAPTRIKRRANFADQSERARITGSRNKIDTDSSARTDEAVPFRRRDWKTADDIISTSAQRSRPSKTTKKEEPLSFGLSQHSDVFNYYTSPFLKDRENAVVQMY